MGNYKKDTKKGRCLALISCLGEKNFFHPYFSKPSLKATALVDSPHLIPTTFDSPHLIPTSLIVFPPTQLWD
jgi:hypothetical protein